MDGSTTETGPSSWLEQPAGFAPLLTFMMTSLTPEHGHSVTLHGLWDWANTHLIIPARR
jgi:hypothetical protein